MTTVTAVDGTDGPEVVPIGRHHEAVSIDFTNEPDLVTIKGDARSITGDGVVTALVDPESNTGDGFWFFEVAEPFASPQRLARATSLLLSLAHVSAEIDDDASDGPDQDLPAKARPTAIVLLSEHADLYLVTKNTPSFSQSDWITWTDYTIPLDSSMPWRIAGPPKIVGGLERLPIDSNDKLASNSEIRETLSSLQSLRIRGGQPARTHLVLLRSLAAIRRTSIDE